MIGRATLSDTLKHYDQVIVEGVCLRESMDMPTHARVTFVYVKRICHMGRWDDGDDLEKPLEPVAGFAPSRLSLDVWAYHQKFQPHLNADYSFERLEAQ
jgi:hypothetical protein